MAKRMTALHGPKGFSILCSVPRIYYRVEADGSATITGAPEKCLLNKHDDGGGHISGGIKKDIVTGRPVLFGERRTSSGSYPLQWVDLNLVDDLAERDPLFTPDPQPDPTPDPSRWVSVQSFKDIQKERDELREVIHKMEDKFEQVRKVAREEITRLSAEFSRMTTSRTVYLEATLVESDQVEGHHVDRWEVGDRRFLVIAEKPTGLSGSWTHDLIYAIEKRIPGNNEIAVAVVPKGAAVRVVELIPKADEEEEEELEDAGQF